MLFTEMSSATVRGKTTLDKYSFCDELINKRYLTSFADDKCFWFFWQMRNIVSQGTNELQAFDLKR